MIPNIAKNKPRICSYAQLCCCLSVTCVEALSENANEEGIDYRDNFA